MNDDLPDDLPQDFDLRSADHLDRVETDAGVRYVVLDSHLHGTRELVREDIVEYGRFDHPLLAGVGGMGWLGLSFVGPPLGAVYALGGVESTALTIGGAALALIAGWLVSNLLLYRTVIGDQVFRFLDWNDNRGAIMAARRGGEVA